MSLTASVSHCNDDDGTEAILGNFNDLQCVEIKEGAENEAPSPRIEENKEERRELHSAGSKLMNSLCKFADDIPI